MNIQLNYDYDKLRTSLRYWMQGREMHTALKAMQFGLEKHTGVRKNGHPEFSHQVFQAQFARTLIDSLLHPEEVLATIFLHDIVEDHDVARAEILARFGPLVGNAVHLMTDSTIEGIDLPHEVYYPRMAECPVTSLTKGIDRMHNFQSMLGVFDIPKQQRYIQETRQYILPMMKVARQHFVEQEPAYQNVKHVLLTQMELIEAMHTSTTEVETT